MGIGAGVGAATAVVHIGERIFALTVAAKRAGSGTKIEA